MTDATAVPATLEFKAVTPERWPDLARLFKSARVGPNYCWCMVWRPMPAGVKRTTANKRAEFEATIRRGTPVGLLAYADGEPVAWCSIAPRDTYGGTMRLGGDTYPPGTSVWSIVCFFAQPEQRGRGIAARLLDAACREAASAGADLVEGYPVDPDSPSFQYMGRRKTFLAAGFEEIGPVGTRRHAMRLWLRALPTGDTQTS